MEARKLVDFPGGLELHIGVRPRLPSCTSDCRTHVTRTIEQSAIAMCVNRACVVLASQDLEARAAAWCRPSQGDGSRLPLLQMFIPTLLSQASPDQQAEWLPKALGVKLIGTYAQTELGHGTFVRGLQTTATYDVEGGHFVLHTPTLTATKWWPGGLGKTSTHVVSLQHCQ